MEMEIGRLKSIVFHKKFIIYCFVSDNSTCKSVHFVLEDVVMIISITAKSISMISTPFCYNNENIQGKWTKFSMFRHFHLLFRVRKKIKDIRV